MSTRIKKFNELTKELKETIKNAKDKLIEAIINDNEISKVEKLELIHENDLFGVGYSIVSNIFAEYYEEFRKQLGGRLMLDEYFSMQEYERYSIVYMDEVMEMLDDDDDDGMVTILFDRYSKKKFKISHYEFIDVIYDWCISNKKIGFKMDW